MPPKNEHENEYTVNFIVGRATPIKKIGLELRTYQNAASTTAIYNGRKKTMGLFYCAIGLAGEVGELLNKIKKINRDNIDYKNDKVFREQIEAELGDVLWYWSQIIEELEMDASEIADKNILKLKNRKKNDKLKGFGDER